MTITATANYQFQQNRITATQVVASGGRTLTFNAAADTVTASSGDFTTEGYSVGGLLIVAGTSSNDSASGFIIVTVTPTVITVTGGMANEGPLSATATLDGTSGKAFVFDAELQNGRYGHFMESSFASADGSLTMLWDTGPGVPEGFTAWGAGGVWIDTKLGSRGSWGALGVDVTLSVLDPADGTTLVSATRTVSAADADYVRLTISSTDLDAAGLTEWDEVRVQLDVTISSPVGSVYPWIHVGQIGADFGGSGGGGGGGGGGTGDLTEVQGTAPIVVTSGTGPIPVVSFSGAALTKVDDTNVTLTLGGTPTTALARAASITAGWTGQLAIARGGTGAATVADHYTLLGPTSGGPLAPTWRMLVAGDLPDLSGTYATVGSLSGYVPTTRAVNTTSPLAGGGALSGDLTLHLGTPATGTVLKGTGSNPSFAALAASDMPVGTDGSYWQINVDGSGPRLVDESGHLGVKDEAGSGYENVRGADPVTADDLVTKRVLDGTALTLGLGLDLLEAKVFDSSTAPDSVTYTLPADTLFAGATGLRLEIAATCRSGGSDQLSVTISGTEVFLDVTGANPTWAASKQIVLHLTLMQPAISPGSLLVSGHVQDSGDLNAATRQFLNTAIKQSYVALDTSIDNDIVVSWGINSSDVNMLLVRFLGGIPANPIVDNETPRTPQPTSASMPTVGIVKKRGGAAPTIHRLSGGTTVSSALDSGTTIAGNETGTLSGLSFARFNDEAEFLGATYWLVTTGTTRHDVFTRPIGGTINTTAVDTQTATVSFANRTGLHVADVGGTAVLFYVYTASTTGTCVYTADGSTWSTFTFTVVALSAINSGGVTLARGIAYLPVTTSAGGTTHGYAVNLGGLTASAITGPNAVPHGCFCSLYGRVFYMAGNTASSTQREFYEVTSGALTSRLTLTSNGNDTTTSVTATNRSPGLVFPISDSKILAVYPTATTGTTDAVWSASTVTFASASDTAPSETRYTSFPPTPLRSPAGATAMSSAMWAWCDNESDPGNGQIYLFWTTGVAAAYSVDQFQGANTTPTGSVTGADPTNYSIQAGDFGGGHRIAPDDSSDLIWKSINFSTGAVAGAMLLTFKALDQGTHTWTVKLFISTYENPLTMAQATLTGTATGGSATRVGNEVQGVDADGSTSYTVSVDFGSMSIADGAHVKAMLKAYREP